MVTCSSISKERIVKELVSIFNAPDFSASTTASQVKAQLAAKFKCDIPKKDTKTSKEWSTWIKEGASKRLVKTKNSPIASAPSGLSALDPTMRARLAAMCRTSTLPQIKQAIRDAGISKVGDKLVSKITKSDLCAALTASIPSGAAPAPVRISGLNRADCERRGQYTLDQLVQYVSGQGWPAPDTKQKKTKRGLCAYIENMSKRGRPTSPLSPAPRRPSPPPSKTSGSGPDGLGSCEARGSKLTIDKIKAFAQSHGWDARSDFGKKRSKTEWCSWLRARLAEPEIDASDEAKNEPTDSPLAVAPACFQDEEEWKDQIDAKNSLTCPEDTYCDIGTKECQGEDVLLNKDLASMPIRLRDGQRITVYGPDEQLRRVQQRVSKLGAIKPVSAESGMPSELKSCVVEFSDGSIQPLIEVRDSAYETNKKVRCVVWTRGKSVPIVGAKAELRSWPLTGWWTIIDAQKVKGSDAEAQQLVQILVEQNADNKLVREHRDSLIKYITEHPESSLAMAHNANAPEKILSPELGEEQGFPAKPRPVTPKVPSPKAGRRAKPKAKVSMMSRAKPTAEQEREEEEGRRELAALLGEVEEKEPAKRAPSPSPVKKPIETVEIEEEIEPTVEPTISSIAPVVETEPSQVQKVVARLHALQARPNTTGVRVMREQGTLAEKVAICTGLTS